MAVESWVPRWTTARRHLDPRNDGGDGWAGDHPRRRWGGLHRQTVAYFFQRLASRPRRDGSHARTGNIVLPHRQLSDLSTRGDGVHYLRPRHGLLRRCSFGIRLWAAVCLALNVAFWLELDTAYWAGTTSRREEVRKETTQSPERIQAR
jgi:hypothetical protein